ncbi:hypothetical protein BC830DRAFT_1155101 [Chytriomyces sp. MP71]|nr:hypothetical protein BC830DRAFT_1155101 [Chytriomyces sp. MP71]
MHALDNLVQPTDHVLLLHVTPQHLPMVPVDTIHTIQIEGAAAAARESAHALLKEYAAVLGARGLSFKAVLLVGSVKESLVQKVNEVGAAVLVVGSHGSDATSRLLLGSTSDYCAHHSCCPVLIVKPTVEQLKDIDGHHAHYPPMYANLTQPILPKA